MRHNINSNVESNSIKQDFNLSEITNQIELLLGTLLKMTEFSSLPEQKMCTNGNKCDLRHNENSLATRKWISDQKVKREREKNNNSNEQSLCHPFPSTLPFGSKIIVIIIITGLFVLPYLHVLNAKCSIVTLDYRPTIAISPYRHRH